MIGGSLNDWSLRSIMMVSGQKVTKIGSLPFDHHWASCNNIVDKQLFLFRFLNNCFTKLKLIQIKVSETMKSASIIIVNWTQKLAALELMGHWGPFHELKNLNTIIGGPGKLTRILILWLLEVCITNR